MRPSGVPYHLSEINLQFEYNITYQVNLKTALRTYQKKYSKKRNDLKRAEKSETDLGDIQKFEKQLDNHSILGWLNNFLKIRNDTKSNLKNGDGNLQSVTKIMGKTALWTIFCFSHLNNVEKK